MTKTSIGLIACAISCSLIPQASNAQFFSGSYINHGGQLPGTLIFPQQGDAGTDVPSLNLDHHFEQSVPALNSSTSPPVFYTGDVSIHGADRSFGIGVDTAVSVPADAAGVVNIASDQISASISLTDTWYADSISGAQTLKFTAAWNVIGNLAVNVDGEAPPGPFQAPYINANAGSTISFFADGDRPNSVTIIGGDPVQAFTNETYNNTFTNQSLPNPLITQSTFTFPSQIVMTFVLANHGSLGVDFEADAGVGAYVDNEDPANSGSAVATSFFGHTFTWGGITNVVDGDTGQPITDWTLRSASGADWAHAASGPSTVPEPSTLGLAALGGLGFFVYGRRGRTERTASARTKEPGRPQPRRSS